MHKGLADGRDCPVSVSPVPIDHVRKHTIDHTDLETHRLVQTGAEPVKIRVLIWSVGLTSFSRRRQIRARTVRHFLRHANAQAQLRGQMNRLADHVARVGSDHAAAQVLHALRHFIQGQGTG